MDVYLHGKRIRLDPSRSLGKGGEADIFELDGGRALKLFKSPDHSDYQGLPHEQKAAEQRIAIHQHKLRAFPTGLPRQVVVPEELVTDRSGRLVVGYSMALIAAAEPLSRYADASFRRAGVSSNEVVRRFTEIHQVLSGLHAAGVVIGDFNDLNALVTKAGVRFIDADSFQFGPYLCTVFSERFVDPRLCDPNASAPQLKHPYDAKADWFAFSVLLMQSLLFVGPYGGIFRPKGLARIAQSARALRRISVFHPDVQYPKPATPYRVLPDEVLGYLSQVFEEDERGVFPLRLLEQLEFTTCPRCASEHARLACPICQPSAAVPVRSVVVVHGDVMRTRIFTTCGVILHAASENGELLFVYHEDGAYRREDGSVILAGALDPSLRFATLGRTTLVGRGSELLSLSPGGHEQRWSVDGDGSGSGGASPAFAANARHRYWASAGRLFRDGDPRWPESAEVIGDVLSGQTRFWVGSIFGLGFYRAANLAVAFTFDAEHRGINDGLKLPSLPGQLIDATCVFDENRAWLFLAMRSSGTTKHLCLVYSRLGKLETSAEATAGDESWLGTLGGKCATQGMLLAATDAGISRIEVQGGGLQKTREFPETEPFVDAGSRLLVGKLGLYIVGPREITVLRMNESKQQGVSS